MRDTTAGVAASAYDMAITGGGFGGRDMSAQQQSESTKLVADAKLSLSAEAFTPQLKLAGQTHNYLGVAADVTKPSLQ